MTDAIKIKEGDCPYPICDDDGTVKDCIKNGHCGCDENQLKNEFENHVPTLQEYADAFNQTGESE